MRDDSDPVLFQGKETKHPGNGGGVLKDDRKSEGSFRDPRVRAKLGTLKSVTN